MRLKYKSESDLDSIARTQHHGKQIQEKKLLHSIYHSWYSRILQEIPPRPNGNQKVLEIGSGSGFIKQLDPEIITSDIQPLANVDMVFSALEIPFDDASLDAIVMVNVFHHLPDATAFIKEAYRTLKKEGRVVMIEPANTFWSRIIYTNFHHELFDPGAGWSFESRGRPMSDANGALPWIVFQKDQKEFHRLFPNFTIAKYQNIMPFSYLLSGGFTMRQLVPDFISNLIIHFDRLTMRISDELGMFSLIVIDKN